MVSKEEQTVGNSGNSEDANNNSYNGEQGSERNLRYNLKQQKVENLNQIMSNESEDWHVLEVDHDIGGDKNCPSSGNNHTEDYHVKERKNVVNKRKHYVDIDPLGSTQEYSPSLSHFCAALYAMIPLLSVITSLLLVYLLFTRFYPITLIYSIWVLLDRKTCNRGGRRLDFVYRSKFYSHLAAYFPIRLRHSNKFKLDPRKNYILNYSPHGIAAFGSVTVFSTNGLNFSELFPGITARFMVHESSFYTPILREVFSSRGDCSVNSRSIDYLLSSKQTGNLLSIVVGGLAEADLSDEEELKVVIAERKGFIKKALLHGANLIPCIGFGENSVFKRVDLEPSSAMHRLYTTWYNVFKFKHPIYYGGSIMSDKLKGLMPYKRPITVVMGDPIEVERSESPTQQQIDKLHAHYVKQLEELYEANTDLCSKYDKKMILV